MALIDTCELLKPVGSYNPIKYTWEYGEVVTLHDITHAPTVDAEPVRHGHWIDIGSGQECSECHEIQYGYDNYRHYCSNCGAKMDD